MINPSNRGMVGACEVVFDLRSGGTKIPEILKDQTLRRILAHAERHYAGNFIVANIYLDAAARDVP